MDQEEKISFSAAGFVFKRIVPWFLLLGMVYYIYATSQSYLSQQPQEEQNPLVVKQASKVPASLVMGTATVLTDGLSFRRRPMIDSERIGRLEKGTVVTVIGRPNSKWYRVQTDQGQTGFIVSSIIDVKFVPKK